MTNIVRIGEVSADILESEVIVGMNTTAKAANNWGNIKSSVEDLISALTKFQVGPKDGQCILQGQLVGDKRMSKAVLANYLLMLDIDTGMPLDEVVGAVRQAGLFAVIWTTYSHRTTRSEIPESKLVQFANRIMGQALGFSDEEVENACKRYLELDKRYHFTVTEDGVRLVERKLKETGVVFVVEHAPMPKCRVMFVLKDPYIFTEGGTQQQRIDNWKARYAAISNELGLPYDASCTDPARLMYLPRVDGPGRLEHAAAYVIAGTHLDLDKGLGVSAISADAIAARFTFGAASSPEVSKVTETQTVGLKQFVFQCPDFDVMGWLRSIAPEDERKGGPAGGMSWTCPNEDNHTEPSPDDTAFAVFAEDGGWGLTCLHEGCKRASGNDRLFWLDRLCVKYGVTDANELREWSETARRIDALDAKAAAIALSPDALESLVASINDKSTKAERDIVFGALGRADEYDLLRHAKTLASKLPISAAEIKRLSQKAAAEAQKRAAQQARQEADEDGVTLGGGHPVPEDLGTASCIWTDWPANTQVEATIARLHHVNERKPFLFRNAAAGVMRAVEGVDDRVKLEVVNGEQWAAIVSEHVTYRSQDPLTGATMDVPMPRHIGPILKGTDKWRFPEVRNVTRVPMFSPEGELQTKRGYDAGLKVYLDPPEGTLPVPKTPTETQVADALSLLREPLRDFPWCDYDDKMEPIYLDERDEDGHPLRNPHRGAASEANMLAMIIQPFVRNLIQGPTPAYHIDKSAPGTGAGFSADVVYGIAEGTRAEIQTMSASNEEFRKNITATLLNGAAIIFVDNINRRVDSGDLAAALTSGVWKDRVLGKTENVTIPVTSMWILAGNNVSATDEIIRRNVPIYMDAVTPDPAMDRGPGSFKHDPLQDWVEDYRPELVQAVHTLIANWFAKGCPRGTAVLNSFTHWSHVMSGILEAAGVTALLKNRKAYIDWMKTGNENSARNFVLQKLAETFGTQRWTAAEALDAVKDPMSGKLLVELPMTRDDDVRAFGRWLGSNIVRATTSLNPQAKYPTGTDWTLQADGRLLVSVNRGISNGVTFYSIRSTSVD